MTPSRYVVITPSIPTPMNVIVSIVDAPWSRTPSPTQNKSMSDEEWSGDDDEKTGETFLMVRKQTPRPANQLPRRTQKKVSTRSRTVDYKSPDSNDVPRPQRMNHADDSEAPRPQRAAYNVPSKCDDIPRSNDETPKRVSKISVEELPVKVKSGPKLMVIKSSRGKYSLFNSVSCEILCEDIKCDVVDGGFLVEVGGEKVFLSGISK